MNLHYLLGAVPRAGSGAPHHAGELLTYTPNSELSKRPLITGRAMPQGTMHELWVVATRPPFAPPADT